MTPAHATALEPSEDLATEPFDVAQLGSAPQAPGAVPQATEQEAVNIRQAIERWLLDFLPPGSASSATVDLQGQVVVEPFGQRYAVTFPDLTINLVNGLSIPFGTLTLSLEPETPVTYAVAMRLPNRVLILDNLGQEFGVFEMGRQRLRGVWDTRFQTMTNLNVTVNDVQFSLRNEFGDMQTRFLLGRGELTSQGEADERFLISGPSKLTMSEMEVRDPNGNRHNYFGSMVAEAEIRGLDMINYNRFARRFQSLAQAFIPSATGELPDRETQDLLLKQLERELVDLPAFLGDLGLAVTISGLVGNDPQTSRGYSIDEVEYTLLARDFDTDVSRMQITYEHRGFTFLPAFQGPGITPGEVSFELDVEGIPNTQLWETIVALPNDMSLYGFQPAVNFAVEKLYHVLATANTELQLKEAFINSEEVDARISGSALFDNGATYKGVASASIRLIGLDEMVNRMNTEATNNPLQAGLLLGLRTLQSLGAVGDPIGGRSNREYILQVGPDRNIALNNETFLELLNTFLGREGTDEGNGG